MHELEARLRGADADLGLMIGEPEGRHRSDATRIRAAVPVLVLRPADTAAMAEALEICNAARQPVCVQGGLTGLSGGARPQDGEIVLSLERMRHIDPVDVDGAMVSADAGVALQEIQSVAGAAGMMFGVDIGSRGSATIGGMVSTNAGGIRVLRYGMMRAQIIGVEAVLADGRLFSSMRGLTKNNAGLDLTHLIVGSEGTLGVVTRAQLRLNPRPLVEQVALASLSGVPSAQTLLRLLQARLGPRLSAFEAIWPEVYRGIEEMRGTVPLPSGAGLYVMVEMSGFSPEADTQAFEETLMQAIADGVCADAVLSQSVREFDAIWKLREDCNEYCFGQRPLTPHDISLPPGMIERFMNEAEALVRAHDRSARILVYGHLGDGNLHYLLRSAKAGDVSARILALAAALGGSLSAEHGVGLDKRHVLPLVRSQVERDTLRVLKAALDPNNILNRGRVLA